MSVRACDSSRTKQKESKNRNTHARTRTHTHTHTKNNTQNPRAHQTLTGLTRFLVEIVAIEHVHLERCTSDRKNFDMIILLKNRRKGEAAPYEAMPSKIDGVPMNQLDTIQARRAAAAGSGGSGVPSSASPPGQRVPKQGSARPTSSMPSMLNPGVNRSGRRGVSLRVDVSVCRRSMRACVAGAADAIRRRSIAGC